MRLLSDMIPSPNYKITFKIYIISFFLYEEVMRQ